MKPTQNQARIRCSLALACNVEGSMAGSVENTRATILECALEDWRVIQLSMCGLAEAKGSSATREYPPFRELNGDTWKSFVQLFLNFDSSF